MRAAAAAAAPGRRGRRASTLLEEHEPAAPRRHDDEVHHEQHQVVMPAVRPPAPESDLPHEDLLLDRAGVRLALRPDRKSTRLNSSHVAISYAVFCLKK